LVELRGSVSQFNRALHCVLDLVAGSLSEGVRRTSIQETCSFNFEIPTDFSIGPAMPFRR
jgi:hypothetical protein